MQRIIFESSPAFILVCLLLGIGYALVLYKRGHPWSVGLNRLLFCLRSIVVFLISFLLLGPIIRQIINTVDKPVFVILHDHSASISETTDSLALTDLQTGISALQISLRQQGYEVVIKNLTGENISKPDYTSATSDLQGALRKVSNQFEGKSVIGLILVSDGIYNSGLSPLYSNYNFPIYTIGIGDTLQRQDLVIKNLAYNKIAYQGNRFPVRVEVQVKGYAGQPVSISLLRGGKLLERQRINSGNQPWVVADFNPVADEIGVQRFDVQVEVKPGERNVRNNRATGFVEVVEGKKKILVVASAPHPDIKALRAVVERNPNYEFLIHIPGVQETEAKNLQPSNIDLVIFHQAPDRKGRTRELFQRFTDSRNSLLIIVGQQTDLSLIAQRELPLMFEQPPRQFDDVMPVVNPAFTAFTLSAHANSQFAGFPPVWVPFGKMHVPASVFPLLYQKVGSLTTEKPLLWIESEDKRKVAVMLAEGFWQWRLHEFSREENTVAFDEVFGKLIQYLSTVDDKRKFRSYPIQQQFSETEAVVFESQVYNDIYEHVYGNTISLELTDEAGKRYTYSYVTNPGNVRYQVGGLKEGVYRYMASTAIRGKDEVVRGQFMVLAQQAELQNLTADFDLLRKLSQATGGQFVPASQVRNLEQQVSTLQARAVIHSDESYDSLLNLKSVFFLLLVLISAEWFLRKYFGSY